MGRTEAVEDRGFRVIEIWELQNDLVARWPFVPFVHMSGLHAADMPKNRPAAGNLASVSASAIWHQLKIDDVCSLFGHSADRRCSLIYAANFILARSSFT